MQAWDNVGQPAIEMAKGSWKAERPHKTKVFVPLAITVASATEAYQEKVYFKALVFVSFSLFLGETRMCCTVFLGQHLLENAAITSSLNRKVI